MRRLHAGILGAAFGALLMLSAMHSLSVTTTNAPFVTTVNRGWGALRPTACDGLVSIPHEASIGNFSHQPVQLLRTLTDRKGLASLANSLNLTNRAVELGVWRGEFAEQNLKLWNGRLYVLVDLWMPSDCVNGNRSHCVYGSNVCPVRE